MSDNYLCCQCLKTHDQIKVTLVPLKKVQGNDDGTGGPSVYVCDECMKELKSETR